MVLKSYRLKDTFKKKARKIKPLKKGRDVGRILTGGITALIGTAFVTQIAGTLNRL